MRTNTGVAPTHRALVLLFVAALLMASCGGDKGDKAGKGATTTVATSTPPTSTATTAPTGDVPNPGSSDPAKADRAKTASLQATDLPPGWREQPPEDQLDLEIVWQDITRCVGVERKGQPLGFATSPTFLRGLATQVRSTVEYMPQPSDQAVAALAGPRLNECANPAFAADAKRNAPEGGVPGPVTLSPLAFPQLGRTTVAIRATFTVNLNGLEVPLTQDLVAVFNGEAVIRMLFLNPGSPFPPDLQRSLAEKVVGRA